MATGYPLPLQFTGKVFANIANTTKLIAAIFDQVHVSWDL